MPFSESSLEQALKALGELLDSRGLEYRLAAVGGGAMLLLGLLDRPTNDLDVVTQADESGAAVSADPLASPLREAIIDVARAFLEALEPTREELLDAARWARTHDPSDGFRAGLEAALDALGVRATDEQL